MRVIILEGKRLKGREETHDYLARMLEFPEYYGRNLDALYDCLSELPRETAIILRAPEKAEGYGKKALETIKESKYLRIREITNS